MEHVFASLVNGIGGKLVRTIGIVRARTRIGLQTLTCNMRRFVCRERMKAATR